MPPPQNYLHFSFFFIAEDIELGLVKKRDGNIMVLVWKKHTFSHDVPKEPNLKIIDQRMDLKTAYSRGGAGICEM